MSNTFLIWATILLCAGNFINWYVIYLKNKKIKILKIDKKGLYLHEQHLERMLGAEKLKVQALEFKMKTPPIFSKGQTIGDYLIIDILEPPTYNGTISSSYGSQKAYLLDLSLIVLSSFILYKEIKKDKFNKISIGDPIYQYCYKLFDTKNHKIDIKSELMLQAISLNSK